MQEPGEKAPPGASTSPAGDAPSEPPDLDATAAPSATDPEPRVDTNEGASSSETIAQEPAPDVAPGEAEAEPSVEPALGAAETVEAEPQVSQGTPDAPEEAAATPAEPPEERASGEATPTSLAPSIVVPPVASRSPFLSTPPRTAAAVGLLLAFASGASLLPIALAPHSLEGAAVSAGAAKAPFGASTDAGVASVDADAREARGSLDGGVVDAGPRPPPAWRVAQLQQDSAYEVTQGTIGKRPLLAALAAAGLPKDQSRRLLRAFEGVKRLERCGPKDTFLVAREKKSGRLVAFELAVSQAEVWQAREKTKDGSDPSAEPELEASKLTLDVERTRVAVAVPVGEDLRTSVTRAGLDEHIVKMLDDALDGHAELTEVRAGARLRVVATEERVDGAFTRYAELDAVEYFPASGAKPLRVYHYARSSKSKRGAGFYDSKGQQPYRGAWRSPVPLARISSRFNPHRMHPVLHVVRPHNGVDFAAGTGTPVYATASGTVQNAGDGGPCGNMVQVAHANGLTSVYCHLSRFAAGLHAGQRVDARQLVGYVGQTGRVTGPHLHFGIKRGDSFIDPLSLKLDGVRVIPRGHRESFAQTRSELDELLDSIPLPAGPEVDGGAPGGDEPGEADLHLESPH